MELSPPQISQVDCSRLSRFSGQFYCIRQGAVGKVYLHKNGEWKNYCGENGFFPSQEEIKKLLDSLEKKFNIGG